MTDGQYYGARKLCHNIAAIYCCVCHRPVAVTLKSCRKFFRNRNTSIFWQLLTEMLNCDWSVVVYVYVYRLRRVNSKNVKNGGL